MVEPKKRAGEAPKGLSTERIAEICKLTPAQTEALRQKWAESFPGVAAQIVAQTAFQKGAAVAFGLMGMAEAIRENYCRVCRACGEVRYRSNTAWNDICWCTNDD